MTTTSQAAGTSATQATPPGNEEGGAPGCSAHQASRPGPAQGDSGRPLPWVTVKDILWALYLYPARWLSRVSPAALTPILYLAGPVFQLLSVRRKDEVRARLAVALGPDTPRSALRALARSFIAHCVRRAGDDLALDRADAPVRCLRFDGREHLDAAVAAGKGVLFASLHWHAGRAANRALAAAGYPVMTVRTGRPPDRRMGRLGRRFLQPRYVRFLHDVIRDEVFIQDPECSLKILARLRSGGVVDIHLDASLTQHVIVLPFLGETRRFPVGPLRLARVCGCAVLPLLAMGHAQALDIRIGRPLIFDRDLPPDAFCRAHLPGLVRTLESYVLEHPDQWELWTRL